MRYIAVLNVRLYFNSEAVVFKLINLVYEMNINEVKVMKEFENGTLYVNYSWITICNRLDISLPHN